MLPAAAPSTKTMAAIIRNFVNNMDLKTPWERIAIEAGIDPAVNPTDTVIAIPVVELASAAGTADALVVPMAVANTPAGRARPRRINRPRSRSFARDNRALIVPTGRTEPPRGLVVCQPLKVAEHDRRPIPLGQPLDLLVQRRDLFAAH